jgi:predicted MFS family arabinose efflux permease
MKAGIISLVLAYVLSQFYRAFLAVLTPVLSTDLGVTSEDLASASGLWFLAFAAMQIPVGSWLDRFGPRWTSALLFGVCGSGGALLFAAAGGAWDIKLAMALIGIGCSPVLMASYYLFARFYPPAIFATMATVVVGVGSLGNIASSLPLALAVDLLGWRGTMVGLAVLTAVIAVAIAMLLRDPERIHAGSRGSVLDILRMPALWLILPMIAVAYVPAAAVRGLWVGPYYADVFGADSAGIGTATLVMGLAMVLGNFAYGPMDRLLHTRKWVIFGGNTLGLICLLGLWAMPLAGGMTTIALLAGLGFFGASYGVLVAHGRAFIPAHLTGRGVTLMNLFSIAPVGISQIITGRLHAAAPAAPPEAAYTVLFAFYAICLAVGLAIYLFSKDRID